MRSIITALPLLALAANVNARSCGNEHVPQRVMDNAKQLYKMEHRADARTLQSYADRKLVVDTYFHVIAVNETAEGWNIPDDKLKGQLDRLNYDYDQVGISFNLKNITRTISEEFANDPDEEGTKMKKALRQGSYAALNIYFRPLGQGLLGICVFPEDIEVGSDTFMADGCQVHSDTIPGGSFAPYDEGKTATHEIGHWFNLFHTFQGGCNGGDLVDDTPAESSAAFGCPKGRNTCSAPGDDPIENFMDYSDDACMYKLTDGQKTRIFTSWDQFRAKWVEQPGENE
ncbi:Ulilysin [Orbilia brochopaga]|nr:Ulilysin [Drechslerella brochopaga]